MIDDPALLTIAEPTRRPEAEQLASFSHVSTSFIVDAMGGTGALDRRIKAVGAVLPIVGVALTCHCGPADNLALCAAVNECQPGDVIIAATDGFAGCAVVGDLLLGIAKNRGAAGFVTDGMVRDVQDIETMGFACYAMGVTPNSPVRNGPGSVGLPILCGGRQIETGDLVVADRDGVVIVPFEAIPQVIERLKSVRAAEARLSARIAGGLTEVDFVPALRSAHRIAGKRNSPET